MIRYRVHRSEKDGFATVQRFDHGRWHSVYSIIDSLHQFDQETRSLAVKDAEKLVSLLNDAADLHVPNIEISPSTTPRIDIRYGKLFTLAHAEQLRRLIREITT